MTNCIKPVGRVLTASGLKDVSCKMRNCPVCSKVLRNQLMDRVKAFYLDSSVYFNTITLQADDHTNIMRHWKKLTDQLRYYYPHLLIFWTKEYTKRGQAHLHFLTNQALDGQWLSRTWLNITGTSYIVKCGNTTGEIRNPAAYMLKYMTKAHNSLDLFDKGERIYGFLGARAPAVPKKGFDEEPLEFVLDQHYNPSSNYWPAWYDSMQKWIGPAFISYMNYQTLSPIQKLNYESANVEAEFTKVQQSSTPESDNELGQVEKNKQLLSKWKDYIEERGLSTWNQSQ